MSCRQGSRQEYGEDDVLKPPPSPGIDPERYGRRLASFERQVTRSIADWDKTTRRLYGDVRPLASQITSDLTAALVDWWDDDRQTTLAFRDRRE